MDNFKKCPGIRVFPGLFEASGNKAPHTTKKKQCRMKRKKQQQRRQHLRAEEEEEDIPLIPTIFFVPRRQLPMTCLPLLGRCHDDKKKDRIKLGVAAPYEPWKQHKNVCSCMVRNCHYDMDVNKINVSCIDVTWALLLISVVNNVLSGAFSSSPTLKCSLWVSWLIESSTLST